MFIDTLPSDLETKSDDAITEVKTALDGLTADVTAKLAPVADIAKRLDVLEARLNRPTVETKRQDKLAPGIAVARIARVKALAAMTSSMAREKAAELYGEDSDTYGYFAKAAVAPALTSDASWAGNLVGDETSVFADFVEYLRPQTILGKFGQGGIPSLRNVGFRMPLIGQTSGGSGYWVGEGKAKPLTKFDFSRTTLEPLKVANIAVASKEVLRDSSPSADGIIRDSLVAALRERLTSTSLTRPRQRRPVSRPRRSPTASRRSRRAARPPITFGLICRLSSAPSSPPTTPRRQACGLCRRRSLWLSRSCRIRWVAPSSPASV